MHCNLILRMIVVHCIAVPEPQRHQNIKPTWAIALSAKLMYGNEKNNLPDPTVWPVFSLYLIFFGFRKQQLHFHLSTGTQSEEEKLVLQFSSLPGFLFNLFGCGIISAFVAMRHFFFCFTTRCQPDGLADRSFTWKYWNGVNTMW